MYHIVALLSATLLWVGADAPGIQNTTPTSKSIVETTIERHDDTIEWKGTIGKAELDKFKRLLQTPGSEVTALSISSTGGDPLYSLELGRIVRDRKLKVRVPRVCGLLCATHVLPSTSSVEFGPDALVPLGMVPSPQFRAVTVERVLRDPQASAADRDKAERGDQLLRRVLTEQAALYTSLGIKPERPFRAVDVWMSAVQLMSRGSLGREAGQMILIPDTAFLQRCMGFTRVAWRNWTAGDSARLARVQGRPAAFVVGDAVYYDGRKLFDIVPPC